METVVGIEMFAERVVNAGGGVRLAYSVPPPLEALSKSTGVYRALTRSRVTRDQRMLLCS